MIKAKTCTRLFCLIVSIVGFSNIKAQENIGLATGNYAGISGLWMNPANAVDSRYKFDINIIGINSYFSNNYLVVKNGALARRLFHKAPYNNSFEDVKKDLLQEGTVSGRVFARTQNTIHLPLSFLITTGPKSAIAFTMTNRTVNAVSGLNSTTAKMFYDELGNKALYNVPMNNDSLRYNFLNWQEVGLTYGRVLIGKGNIFLKAAVTVKWLGAGAGGFMQTDKATLTFKDAHTLSLNSPLIRYGRTATADVGAFSRKNLFNNLEDQSWGMDAGIVFEWRGNLNKFKYRDEDANTLLRKDKNKYILRLGVSVVDIGGFTLTRKALTNDHSASIADWDFGGIKANNFSDFDSAYSKKVNYVAGSPSTFTYRLPGAAIINADLHLFGGLYINVASKQPLAGYGRKATTYIEADRWTVITPRFEGSFMGIYVPVTRVNNQTNVGLTVKFGPLYIGSNNLAQILTNDKSMEADLHAGLRLSILQGKPPKIWKTIEGITGKASSKDNETKQRLDTLTNELAVMKMLEEQYRNQKPVTIIINNDGSKSDVVKQNNDSVVIANKSLYNAPGANKNQTDTLSDYYIRQLALRQVEIKKLQQQLDEKNNGKKAKKLKKSNDDVNRESDEMLQDEIEKIKRQNRGQNAAIITAVGATAIISNNSKKGNSDSSISQPVVDSAKITTARDTVYHKVFIVPETRNIVKRTDTVYVYAARTDNPSSLSDTVYFAINSIALTGPGIKRIKRIALTIVNQPQYSVHLTGRTDATGTNSVNKKIASGRVATVRNMLLNLGIQSSRITLDTEIAGEGIANAEMLRRVDIIVSDDK